MCHDGGVPLCAISQVSEGGGRRSEGVRGEGGSEGVSKGVREGRRK